MWLGVVAKKRIKKRIEMINKVTLVGSLGKDPESRFFASGDQQVLVAMATSERWKDKQTGERKEKVSWHNLVFNNGLAKIADEYLKKGSKIYVEGKIDYQEWEKDSVKKYMTRIVVSEMKMLDSREGNAQQQTAPANQTQSQQRPQQQKAPQQSRPRDNFDAPYDDDIPF